MRIIEGLLYQQKINLRFKLGCRNIAYSNMRNPIPGDFTLAEDLFTPINLVTVLTSFTPNYIHSFLCII